MPLSLPSREDVLRLPPDTSFQAVQAKRLIRELNFLPNETEARPGSSGDVPHVPGELLECQVRLLGVPDGVGTSATRPVTFACHRLRALGDCACAFVHGSFGSLVQNFGLFSNVVTAVRSVRMFYFCSKPSGKKEDPVVIWLTGGPGCSSELAVFYENGPFTIANNMSLVWNRFGWDTISNIIFVDQPTGTGFSYSSDDRDTRHDETGVSNDLYDFLQVFFKKHPEFAKNDFYITGESYAGHYIPAFASRVHQGNKANEGIHINLKGFAIGNGLTDPEIQYKAYTDYALEMNLIEKSDYERINRFIPPCEFAIKMCGTDGKTSCMAAYMVCNNIFSSIMKLVGTKNYYDVRKECEGRLCYDFSNLEKFFGDKAVKEALGVGDIEFVSCSTTVYEAMLTDWMRNLEVGIPALLEDGINVLIYAGEYDLICNWLGNSRWVNSMEWSGQKDFVSSPESSFVVDDAEAGVLKSHGPLSFLKVHNAGHMVPMDQPKASLEMLRRFTQGKLKEALPEPAVFKAVM